MLVLSLALSLGAGARSAWGGPSPATLTQRAKALYANQRYLAAIRAIAPVVRHPQATAAQRVDAFELLGLSFLILGDTTRARAAFERLLELDPLHTLDDPSGSPKLRSFFERTKRAYRQTHPGAAGTATGAAPPSSSPAPQALAVPSPAGGPPENGATLRPGEPIVRRGPTDGARRPFYRRWWFWTLVGAAVVTSVTAIAVAATRPADIPGGSLAPPLHLP